MGNKGGAGKRVAKAVTSKPDPVKKILVFDFGSVLRVKTVQRTTVIGSLVQKLKERLTALGIDQEVPGEEKGLRKLLKPSDWKTTVGAGELSRAKGWRNGFKELGVPIESAEDKKWIAEFVKELDFDGKEVMDEMRALLEEMNKNPHVELAVLSNHSMELYDWFKNIFNFIPQYFDEKLVLVSAKVKVRKPDPAVFQALLDMLDQEIEEFHPGFHRENVMLIDNKEENCKAAEEHGMKSYLYLHDPENRLESFRKLEQAVRTFLENEVK